jgi:hypothetical protein
VVCGSELQSFVGNRFGLKMQDSRLALGIEIEGESEGEGAEF